MDVGTGYYVKKDVKSAADFLNKKCDFVAEQSGKVAAFIKKKQDVLEEVQNMLMAYQQSQAGA